MFCRQDVLTSDLANQVSPTPIEVLSIALEVEFPRVVAPGLCEFFTSE